MKLSRHLPRLTLLLALATIAALTACEKSPTDPGNNNGGGTNPPPPAPSASIDSITGFAPGESATLWGSHLGALKSLSLDDQAITLDAGGSATRKTFTAPALRTCEVDGRSASLLINDSTSASAPLRLAHTEDFALGESRDLDPTTMPTCLILPEGQDFVVTATNAIYFDRSVLLPEDSLATRPLVRFRTYTGSTREPTEATFTRFTAPGPSFNRLPGADGVSRFTQHQALERRYGLRAQLEAGHASFSANTYSDNPTPFDPAYTTAEVGDTVHFIARTTDFTDVCNDKNTPTFPALVLAVSGKTVIALDLRSPYADHWQSPEMTAELTQAAQTADAVLLPTMRILFNEDYTPLAGGGGRNYAVITNQFGGIASMSTIDVSAQPQSQCPNASEMIATAISDDPGYHDTAAEFANTLVHEYAHNADEIVGERMKGSNGSGDWTGEAWAMQAEMIAARLASGQTTDARVSKTRSSVSAWSSFYLILHPYPDHSTWTGTLEARRYSQVGSFLLYLREQAGDAELAPKSSTLYQRLVENSSLHPGDTYYDGWDFVTEARIVGSSPEALLRGWSVAMATAGFLSSEEADQAGTPHLHSWDLRELAESNGPWKTAMSATTNQVTTLAAAAGNYATRYLFTSEENSKVNVDHGVSLSFPEAPSARTLVTITRIH